jgi:hypothetical protein
VVAASDAGVPARAPFEYALAQPNATLRAIKVLETEPRKTTNVVGVASFVALVWADSAESGLSPLTRILMPPAPGAPSLWLGMVLVALALQAAALFGLVDYVTKGNLPRDFGDLLGILFFGVAHALVVGGLNARAFLLEVREFFQ